MTTLTPSTRTDRRAIKGSRQELLDVAAVLRGVLRRERRLVRNIIEWLHENKQPRKGPILEKMPRYRRAP